MSVSIYAGDFNKANNIKDEVDSGVSINYKENHSARAQGIGAYGGVVISGGEDNSRLKDNTYESLLKEAEDVKEQLMNSAQSAKISFKALVKKLSGMESVDIQGEGFNIMDSSPEEMVSIIDKIRIELAIHSDDYVAYGTGVSKSAIKKVAGSAGVSADVVERLSNAGAGIDEDSLKQAQSALDMAAGIGELSENAKYYMIANDIEPTIEGIYKAEGSVSDLSKAGGYQITYKEFEDMRTQIEAVVKKAGLEVDAESLNNAKGLINNNLPVTEKNLKYKAMLDSLELNDLGGEEGQSRVLDKIADQMAIGEAAAKTPLTNDSSIWENVKSAIVTIAQASYDDIVNVISSGRSFTIASLKMVMQAGWGANSAELQSQQAMSVDTDVSVNTVMSYMSDTEDAQYAAQTEQSINEDTKEYQYKLDKAYNTLTEARLLLTAGSGIALEKNNISLMYTPLEELTEKLKTMESKSLTYAGNMQMYNNVLEVRKALYDIEIAPAQMYEKLMNSDPYKLNIAMVSNVANSLRNRYSKAIDTYKNVGTQVRTDLKDSLAKAVDNSASQIIEELRLENTKENRAVIRLLAANNIDITKEAVNKAGKIYSTLNSLVDNMKPETVIRMLDDGINPMDTDIWTVNDYLSRLNQGATKDNEEKYSRFLYKLEKTGGISETKKQQFIGIYQMMNIFVRDAGVCAGALMEQGKDITMGNLISAYTSRKHAGMDVQINDTTGVLEDKEQVSYYESLFADSQKYITPNTLKKSDMNMPIESQNVEYFTESLSDNYDEQLERELDNSYIQEITRMAVKADEEITRELRRAEADVNIGNTNAVSELLLSGELKAYKKLFGGAGTTDASGEQEYGEADNSGNTSNNNSSALIDSREKLADVLSGREKLMAMYTELEETVSDKLEEAIKSSLTDTKEDITAYEAFEELRISNRQIRYISGLARKNDYRIPYVKNGKAGLINLTFHTDSEDKGKISVRMNTQQYGDIAIEAKVTKDAIALYVKQESTSEAKKADGIDKELDKLREILRSDYGIDDVKLDTVKVDAVNYVTYEDSDKEVPSDKLYRIAQAVTGVFFGK